MNWAIKITEQNLPEILKYRNFGEKVDFRTEKFIGKYMHANKHFSAKNPSKTEIVTKIP